MVGTSDLDRRTFETANAHHLNWARQSAKMVWTARPSRGSPAVETTVRGGDINATGGPRDYPFLFLAKRARCIQLLKGVQPPKAMFDCAIQRRIAMSFKTMMIIKAIVCLFFAPLLLFFPAPLYTLLGSTWSGGAADFAAREYGAALVGLLLLTWFARKADDSFVRRAIALGLCVYDALGFIVTVITLLQGGLNWLGWGIAFIYLFFAVGFAFFIAPKK